jgi:hypothetical protein
MIVARKLWCRPAGKRFPERIERYSGSSAAAPLARRARENRRMGAEVDASASRALASLYIRHGFPRAFGPKEMKRESGAAILGTPIPELPPQL